VLLESLKKLIQPGDKLIYQRFNAQVQILKGAIVLLNRMLNCNNEEELKELAAEVRVLYLNSVDAYRINTAHLAKTFITPIDRESVHELYIRLHGACRGVYLTSRSLSWMLAEIKDKELVHMGQILLNGADELESLIYSVEAPGKYSLMKHALQMHGIRREMDMAYEQALKKLYEEEHNPAGFIIRHEIFSALRNATETCQEIAHTGENIYLTNVG
jgi:uncharacterized protein Yka (UPF0111/DUF47 family)